MKGFIAGFLLCAALVGLAAWAYTEREDELSRSPSWYEHDEQTYQMNADIEVLNHRIYAECSAIEDLAGTIKAPELMEIQAQLRADVQQAKDVCAMFAYVTFDVALLRKLRGYNRQELGFNLISAGFNADSLIDSVNMNNDILLSFEQNGGHLAQGLYPLLVSLRNDMDLSHALASRLKCEHEASKPIHHFATNP